MDNPTVAEAIKARQAMERTVADAIRAFETKFGVEVDCISIRREHMMGATVHPIITTVASVAL